MIELLEVVGPLLLIHGWPQTWYAWRLMLPALAEDFEVVAVDQRGISVGPLGRWPRPLLRRGGR